MTARDPLTEAAEEAMADRGDRDREAAWEASAGAIDGRPTAYEMRDEAFELRPDLRDDEGDRPDPWGDIAVEPHELTFTDDPPF